MGSGVGWAGLTGEQREAVDRLIREGRKVIALKVLMDVTGCALYQAMDALAERSAELGEPEPAPRSSSPR
jgi:hypothetical protein